MKPLPQVPTERHKFLGKYAGSAREPKDNGKLAWVSNFLKFCPALGSYEFVICFTEFSTKIDEKMSHLNQILNRYASERVTLRQTEKTKAKGFCRPIVEGIVEYVKIKDTRFAGMEIKGNGSYYERCKVGEPNEFDFMLVIKGLELDGVYEYDGMSEPPIGRYVLITFDNNISL